jgi:hypothetical protein
MSKTKELSWRNFMQIAIWGIGGVIYLEFGVPAGSKTPENLHDQRYLVSR